jgi:plastocyanin
VTARAAAAAALLALAAASAPAAAAPRTFSVVIDKMKFGAVPAGVHAGDTIVWVNKDMFRHTATARDNSFSVDLPAGKSGRTVVRHAGATAFYCKFHPGMTGTLTASR